MKKYNHIFLIASFIFIVAGCKKTFEEMNVNENKPTSVPPALPFNGILNDMYDAPYTMFERWSQYYCCNYDYYGNNRYDFGSGTNYFSTLKNVTKMEEKALKNGAGTLNPYSALAKFFKAYFFTKMSLQMGDIPMIEALKGSGNLTPKYDPQKNVFKQALAWLDTANTELGQLISSNNLTLSGDIYFDNNLSKWRKVVNTFKLRLLVNLSKKASDADLNIKQQFSAILSDANKYPLMTSMSDNMQYAFIHPTNDYPMSPDNFGFDALRYNTSATYISLLTQTSDPRVFVTAEPASAITAGGTSPTSFSAFVGAPPGEDLGIMYVKANSGQYSLINRRRYYQTYTGEPSIQIGYPEMLFNIAEAINRGWISSGPLGNAEAHYKAAIKASMAYYGIPESGSFSAYFLQSGSPGTTAVYNSYSVNFNFDTFYNQVGVLYAGDNASGLTQILKEKYIALFRHSGLESYFTYRRTGVPIFTTGPGTGNGSRIAMRFKYPGSETSANADNYKAALQSQFGGNDDINGMMWILQ
ncbi:MAG TPA: SusD/RagB family nutrient-binding outer membrane lipoprotein [Ignavibacteria bacterium]